MQPLEGALCALRQGVACTADLHALTSSVSIALHLDARGEPLGMAGHFRAAAEALAAICGRAGEVAAGEPFVLHLAEIELVQTAIDLHEVQLGQLPSHLYARAVDHAALPALPRPARAPRAYPQSESLPLLCHPS